MIQVSIFKVKIKNNRNKINKRIARLISNSITINRDLWNKIIIARYVLKMIEKNASGLKKKKKKMFEFFIFFK